MVHIVLDVTIKNWLLDTSDGSLRHAIKYLILLRRCSLEVFIDQSVIVHRIDSRFLLRSKLIIVPALLALILLAYCLSKRRKTVISERIKVWSMKLLRLLRASIIVVYFVYLIGNRVHLLIRSAYGLAGLVNRWNIWFLAGCDKRRLLEVLLMFLVILLLILYLGVNEVVLFFGRNINTEQCLIISVYFKIFVW